MSGGMAPKPVKSPADAGAGEVCNLLFFGFGRGSKARPFPLLVLTGCVAWAELQPDASQLRTTPSYVQARPASTLAYLLEATPELSGL